MNSWAFCEWFNDCTPVNMLFEQAYAKRVRALDQIRILADAAVKPVPAHSTLEGGKSTAVVAHQLLKRNRNIRYASRKGRMPPSVMMARFAGDTLVRDASIAGALDAIAGAILAALERTERDGILIDVRNPKCNDDCFTDRWPENHAAQRTYIDDLKLFRRQLVALMSDQFTLDQKRDLLVAMFGEGPAQSAIDDYAANIGRAVQSGDRTVAPSGKVIPAASVAAPSIISSAYAQPRGHTFYGTKQRSR